MFLYCVKSANSNLQCCFITELLKPERLVNKLSEKIPMASIIPENQALEPMLLTSKGFLDKFKFLLFIKLYCTYESSWFYTFQLYKLGQL